MFVIARQRGGFVAQKLCISPRERGCVLFSTKWHAQQFSWWPVHSPSSLALTTGPLFKRCCPHAFTSMPRKIPISPNCSAVSGKRRRYKMGYQNWRRAVALIFKLGPHFLTWCIEYVHTTTDFHSTVMGELLWYSAVSTGEYLPTFRTTVLSQSSHIATTCRTEATSLNFNLSIRRQYWGRLGYSLFMWLSMFLLNNPCLEKVAVAVRILLAFVTKGMTGTEDL